MEFNEKLLLLRKLKGLTQEELAEELYVSRTAISKWESGRGFPNIESLKAISGYFSVSMDELLSDETLFRVSDDGSKEEKPTNCDLAFGLLDCSMVLLMFLPLFGQNADGIIQNVSVVNLTRIQPYLKAVYLTDVLAVTAMGIAMLALQGCRQRLWMQNKHILSAGLNALSVCLFIITRQPYAAALTFFLLSAKVFMLVRRQGYEACHGCDG